MKLRVTSLLLGILVLVAVIVPAFAAAVDKTEDTTAGEETVVTEQSPVVEETNQEVNEDTEATEDAEDMEGRTEGYDQGAVEITEIASESPYYLGDVQLTDLEYQTISGTHYVTVSSFLYAVTDSAEVNEKNGVVNATATAMASVLVDAEGDSSVETVEEVVDTLKLTARRGYTYVEANGRYLYVPGKVQMVNNCVAIPLETLAKVFNLNVSYEDDGSIVLTRKEGADAFLTDGASYYNSDTLYWLSRIIYSESGNQPLLGKIAVGNVVMNRVNSAKFPGTIKGVLFQKNQFSPAMSGSIYRNPNAESVIAAKLVMDGAVALKGVLFFNVNGLDTYAARNRTYVATIGGHTFYR